MGIFSVKRGISVKRGRGLAMAAAILAGSIAFHGQVTAQATSGQPAAGQAAPGQAAADEGSGDPVMDRQLVMQQLDKDSRMMGMILAGIEPKTKLAEAADALAKDAKEVRASFQSKTPGGATKPEAWSNWEDFSKRLDDMVTKTEHMAEVAKTGNFNGVTELVADAIPCRSCHTVYRVPKA